MKQTREGRTTTQSLGTEVRMEKTFVVILLATGFCATTALTSYILVLSPRTWSDAVSYCADVYTTLIQRGDRLGSSWAGYGYSKAWIGLIARPSSWIQQDGSAASYFNWSSGQPDNLLAGLCVSMTDAGGWYNRNCAELRHSICSNGTFFSLEAETNWTNAQINCQAMNSTLVQIPDNTTNAEIRNMLSNGTDIWIDVRRDVFWTWSGNGTVLSSPNWEAGQIQNLTGNELCAAIGLEDGALTQESCDAFYPFICTRTEEDQPISGALGQESKKTLVRLKIQTRANLTEPRISGDFEAQLREVLGNQGVTEIKVTWKKLPGNP